MRWSRLSLILPAALTSVLLLGAPVRAADVDVTSCGQSFRGTGLLQNDLDCNGRLFAGVTIERGTLEMNGFSIRGASPGILCLGRCKINGPGVVVENANGIDAKGKLKLTNVDVRNNEFIGVQCFKSCEITGPGVISGNGIGNSNTIWHGITAVKTVKVRDMTVVGNHGIGVKARSFFKRTGKVILRNTIVQDNHQFGVFADRGVNVRGGSVAANWIAGIVLGEDDCLRARSLVLRDTVVGDNGFLAGCGASMSCADVMSCKRPRSKNVACNTSYVIGSGIPGDDWDLCGLD